VPSINNLGIFDELSSMLDNEVCCARLGQWGSKQRAIRR
jgi:hypothetical protein